VIKFLNFSRDEKKGVHFISKYQISLNFDGVWRCKIQDNYGVDPLFEYSSFFSVNVELQSLHHYSVYTVSLFILLNKSIGLNLFVSFIISSTSQKDKDERKRKNEKKVIFVDRKRFSFYDTTLYDQSCNSKTEKEKYSGYTFII